MRISLDYEKVADSWEVFNPVDGTVFFITHHKFIARFICWASARSITR